MKKQTRKIKRIRSIALLSILTLINCSITFSYWQGAILDNNNNANAGFSIGVWQREDGSVSNMNQLIKEMFPNKTNLKGDASISLSNDIDFRDYNENIQLFPNHHNETFTGVINGRGFKIKNLDLTSSTNHKYRRGF